MVQGGLKRGNVGAEGLVKITYRKLPNGCFRNFSLRDYFQYVRS